MEVMRWVPGAVPEWSAAGERALQAPDLAADGWAALQTLGIGGGARRLAVRHLHDVALRDLPGVSSELHPLLCLAACGLSPAPGLRSASDLVAAVHSRPDLVDEAVLHAAIRVSRDSSVLDACRASADALIHQAPKLQRQAESLSAVRPGLLASLRRAVSGPPLHDGLWARWLALLLASAVPLDPG